MRSPFTRSTTLGRVLFNILDEGWRGRRVRYHPQPLPRFSFNIIPLSAILRVNKKLFELKLFTYPVLAKLEI